MATAKLKDTYTMLTFEVIVTWTKNTPIDQHRIAWIAEKLQEYADKDLPKTLYALKFEGEK